MRLVKFILLLFFLALICSCTKLDEKLGGNLTPSQVNKDTVAASLLRGVYASLEIPFTSYQEIFPLSEFPTDEAIAPTRGADWDDNGIWRAFHLQKWDANNAKIHDCFKSLGGCVFAATNVLNYNATIQQKAEARFLRAWAMYLQLDLFDQVPYRDPGESTIQPARVRKGIIALDYIISELSAIVADLPNAPAYTANKDAAKFLLMKCYLNKAVYQNRSAPAFNVADMNKIISLADEIINSNNNYTFSQNYFDNFSPDNSFKSRENIFTQSTNSDGNYQIAFAWQAVLHYTQGGFNGFTTLSDFYNKFETSDKRRQDVFTYSSAPPNPGNRVNVGFLIGQQYDLFSDDRLADNNGVPVIYTPAVKNIEIGPNITMTGIRPIKYAPDYFNFFYGSPTSNHFVYFRFPDVLLMKAEAIWRGGAGTNVGPYGNNALSIINSIRTDPSRGASLLTTLTLDILLDERGRELWWENWRRQDLIRFKKFLSPYQEKNYESEVKYLLYPIPADQIAVNPNLQQNPGY